MMPFFSIVTPVYNSSTYLSSALDSILSQSFSDFELIVINDGSTDNSAVVCRVYENRDSRIVFIDKNNEGVSKTRNLGLDVAKGMYVLFVDSDDILYPDSLQKLSDILKNQEVDIMHFEHRYIDIHGHECFCNYEARRRSKYDCKLFSNCDFIDKILRNEFYLCMNVFKRSIFDIFNIRFLEGCTYNEDTDLLVRYLLHCKNCVYTSSVVYGYRKFEGAVTHSFTERNFKDVSRVFRNAMSLSNSCLNEKYARSVKYVAEGLGLQLYKYCGMYGGVEDKQYIVHVCTEKPIRIEWKLFPICFDKLWGCASLLRKITRRFY